MRLLVSTVVVLALAGVGCGGGGGPSGGTDTGTGGGMDGGPDAFMGGPQDAGPGVDGGCVPSIELCGDHIDENCDGREDPCGDNDGDHFDACRPTDTDLTMCDCNDRDRNTFPALGAVRGGAETCDMADNDCDGRIDESSACCAGCAGIEAARADACVDGACDCTAEPGTGACAAGETCCDTGCVDTMNDPNNCGSCHGSCGTSADRCVGGSCMCGTSDPCSGAQTCPSGTCM